MTVAELMQSVVQAGAAVAVGVVALPLGLGGLAYTLRERNRGAQSQRVANISIGIAFFALLVIGCWTAYAATVPGMIGATSVLVFIAPLYLLAVSFAVEHLLHPGEQEDVRQRVRKVLLFVTVLGVLYFVLSGLDMHMVIWTNVTGFIFFIVALIGILYLLIRKVV